MSEKLYLDAQTLLEDSFQLGLEIFKSDFRPDFIVGVWRGGTPVGIAVQEILDYLGVQTDHIAIRTASYTGIAQQDKNVKVYGLEYLVENINWDSSLLIVDDVFDSGLSVKAILETLQAKARRNMPEQVRIATPWYKPSNNQTDLVPDYFIHTTDQWLVFPHELDGLTREEVLENKTGMKQLFEKMGVQN